MLAKMTEKGGKDWDRRLPYVLFSYHASQQESTLESPFFLLYGRDPRLPTQAALTPHKVRSQLDLKVYGMEVAAKDVRGMAECEDVCDKGPTEAEEVL